MLLQAPRAEASEGIVQLKNINGSNMRCFAMSTLLNRSSSYQLIIQCRNLIYPVEPEGMFYILWDNPIVKDPKPIRIGDLEFGKGSFNVGDPFSSLFITKEKTQSPNEPSNNKVMEGAIESILFLDTEPTPTLIPSPTIRPPMAIEPTAKITQIVTPTPQLQKGVNFSTVIITVIIIIAIIFIFGIVFYLINKVRNS